MGAAIGAVLPLGLGVALSPVPIIAVVLMLATPRGRLNGPAFVAGWVLGLSLVGTVVLVVSAGAGASDDQAGPATWVDVVKLVLGVALIGLAARQWRGPPASPGHDRVVGLLEGLDLLGRRRGPPRPTRPTARRRGHLRSLRRARRPRRR